MINLNPLEREIDLKERLIELRKYLKMSQVEFANKLSMPQSTYAPLETGRTIRESYIKLICQTYNVNDDWLRNGTLPMFIEEPDHELSELLNIFDNLSPALKGFLLRQAKELKHLQDELNV